MSGARSSSACGGFPSLSRRRLIAGGLVLAAGLALGSWYLGPEGGWRTLWEEASAPGRLSASHVFLEKDCATCHTPVRGVQSGSCGTCHADNAALLQRQPTAFHADIGTCTGCHLEHQGGVRMPTRMDHALLVSEVGKAGGLVPSRTGDEALNCANCHATKDRHQGFLGPDCAQCHGTEQWKVAGFRHPSPRSPDCAQCHKPPPSHNMGHFPMMSARIARQPGAEVRQCFLCHQTTSWNDIKGAGWVKHH